MRALADIASRSAELRIKARVAQDSLETARAYRDLTEEAADRIEESSAASLNFRIEILRERAAARKAVVSQEAEAAEAVKQLAGLAQFEQQLRERLGEVEQSFARGRIAAPIAGIISTNLAHVGQSLAAGTPVAEILDANEIFVDWYIPNERLIEPKVGNEVLVLFGNRRISANIADILPVSDVFAAKYAPLARDRPATQMARIRFHPGAIPPALNSTVHVRMFYSQLASRIADMLTQLFGLQ
jgi:HlyD family secretion protein